MWSLRNTDDDNRHPAALLRNPEWKKEPRKMSSFMQLYGGALSDQISIDNLGRRIVYRNTRDVQMQQFLDPLNLSAAMPV